MLTFSRYFIIAINISAFIGCEQPKLFELVDSSHSNISFINTIKESETLNPLNEVNIYNGGGVGAGDFNHDGLTDLYFTANMTSNKLYLNKGDFKFEDVTLLSHTGTENRWSRGVSVIDINMDGWDDLYISVAIAKDPQNRKNLLFVNQGNNAENVPVFKEMASEYGLDDTTHTAMTSFFDFDNDGDLDAYLVVNHHLNNDNQNRFRPIISDGSHPSTGRLYRNDWSDSLQHGFYSDISAEANIKVEGYGHSAVITDINKDGWKDIYVSNDFISSNILYINNRNGTFTDSSRQYFKQTSTFSMGSDMQDINNDGLLDLVELDMNPQDNYRKKMIMEPNSYQIMQNYERYNYQYQYMRNTLQVNQGFSLNQNDSIGHPVFSQVSYLSGIDATDWSWTPLVTDFDNDGLRDIIITNGYPKDITDHDFMIYRLKASKIAKPQFILEQVPEVSLRNYAFKNKGELSFQDVSFDWGFDIRSFSNGATYADLDNDGDMDIVINNINSKALIYKNHSDNNKGYHYLNISLTGTELNRTGFGAWIELYYDNGKQQVYENSPYRGYVSSLQNIAHFGLGKVTMIDSVIVLWPNHKKQVITNVKTDQLLNVSVKNAETNYSFAQPLLASGNIFTEITNSIGINFTHQESDAPDFSYQKLLPHKFSEYSPALSAGDIDLNGFDDLVCGGNSEFPTVIFFQQPDGRFVQKKLFAENQPQEIAQKNMLASPIGSTFKDAGILLFDADADGDLDMYISSGGYLYQANSTAYQDRLYINDGSGNYSLGTNTIPANYTSKSCARAADYDKDGDLDLFVGGRVDPMNYPKPVSSFIFRNDSKKGQIKFTDVTKSIAPELLAVGMVSDAVFSDFDNDGWSDLVLAGEWMPVSFYKNEKGIFKNIGNVSGINDKVGWWNSIAPGDYDNDGDIDYVVGNLGLNSFYRGNEQFPVSVTAKDFDGNGSYDAFLSLYLPTSHDDLTMRQYPAHLRDEVIKQMIGLRNKFQNYTKYALITMPEMFTPDQLAGAIQYSANTFASSFIRNDGGKFTMSPLPVQAQVSLPAGMIAGDFNNDGNLDLIMNGNDFGTDVTFGRNDAMNGLFLRGDGHGGFKAATILESGIYIPGNGKALVGLRNNKGRPLVAASQNNGPLKVFNMNQNSPSVAFAANDSYATIDYADGKRQKIELYYGYSLLSQSSSVMNLSQKVVAVRVTDIRGKTRNIPLPQHR